MKRNGKKSRKIRKLILTCVLSAVVLIVSTYTWFIGLQTVKVKPFDIEIATTEGLFLSMDGKNWAYNLDVTEATPYEGNTNTWATDGLIPMSTVGDLDKTSSTMKLFEKASLTTTPGGYRLLASRINNNTSSVIKVGGQDTTVYKEGNGYVAFDLFIKNLSGEEYYVDNDVNNEEAIYLNFDSAVKVKSNGTDDPQNNTGIENSVRIAFAQLGRVEATTSNISAITGIDCTGTNMTASGYKYATGDVTGICRNAQIWEPNDTKHVNNAMEWYKTSCLTRTGATSYDKNSYRVNTSTDGNSNAVYCYEHTLENKKDTKEYLADTTNKAANALPTYAISRTIEIDDNVDVYDGKEFNTYEANTMSYANYRAVVDALTEEELTTLKSIKSFYATDLTEAQTAVVNKVKNLKLVSYDYFTDTEKDKRGMQRPSFMTLAPNSITKVRVYIWIEGQDIDNYDFAQLGKTIQINFGFTKERFAPNDLENGYDGPDLVTSDNADIVTQEVNS